MQRPLLYSLAFHAGVLVLMMAGLWLGPRHVPDVQPIAVEIIVGPPSRAEVKQAPPPAEAAAVPKREAAAPKPAPRTERARPVEPPKPTPAPAPPEQSVAEAEPEPKPAPTPKIAAPASKPVDKPVPQQAQKQPDPPKVDPLPKPALDKPKEAPAPKKAQPAPPKPIAKADEPKPKPAKADDKTPAKTAEKAEADVKKAEAKPIKKPDVKAAADSKDAAKDDTFDALLKSVAETPKRVQQAEARKGTSTGATIATNKAGDAPPAASADQIQGLIAAAQRQMQECWSLNAGTPGASAVGAFKIDVSLRRDGTASAVTLADRGLLNDPSSRAIAESAQRAAWSCKLSLPPELYTEWREIKFTFDPKQAMAG